MAPGIDLTLRCSAKTSACIAFASRPPADAKATAKAVAFALARALAAAFALAAPPARRCSRVASSSLAAFAFAAATPVALAAAAATGGCWHFGFCFFGCGPAPLQQQPMQHECAASGTPSVRFVSAWRALAHRLLASPAGGRFGRVVQAMGDSGWCGSCLISGSCRYSCTPAWASTEAAVAELRWRTRRRRQAWGGRYEEERKGEQDELQEVTAAAMADESNAPQCWKGLCLVCCLVCSAAALADEPVAEAPAQLLQLQQAGRPCLDHLVLLDGVNVCAIRVRSHRRWADVRARTFACGART